MKKFLAIAMFAAFCALPAMAADRVGNIYETFAPNTVCEIMQAKGYTVSFDTDGEIIWQLDGYKTYITFNKGNRSITFYAIFKAPDTTLEKHNEFNKDYRFGRSLMPKPGSARLEVDLEFDGGISQERLEDFFKTCQVLFSTWREKVL